MHKHEFVIQITKYPVSIYGYCNFKCIDRLIDFRITDWNTFLCFHTTIVLEDWVLSQLNLT